MKKQNLTTRQLAWLAICIALSLVSKRLIAPITNVLTDLIRIPGGGAATAFSLMFLILGCSGVEWRFAGTFSALTQGILALILGMSGYQGALILVSYTVPGMVMDLVRRLLPAEHPLYYPVVCTLTNISSALLSNLLVFRLYGIAFLLWLLVAAWCGILAGCLGRELHKRIRIGIMRGAV